LAFGGKRSPGAIFCRFWVEPDGRHAGRLGAGDIRVESISHEPDLLRRNTEPRRCGLEQERVRLSHAVVRRDNHEGEVLREPMLFEFAANHWRAKTGVAHYTDRHAKFVEALQGSARAGHRPRLHRGPPKTHLELRHGRNELNAEILVNQPGEARPRRLYMSTVTASCYLSRDTVSPRQHLLDADMRWPARRARKQPLIACAHIEARFFGQRVAVVK
jgi:hypothetical protein